MSTRPVWLNGRVVDPAEATVSVFDHGLTVGDGVFETMKTVRQEPFASTRHLRRLRTSAAGLGLVLDRDDDALRAAVVEIIDAHTDGPDPDGELRAVRPRQGRPVDDGRVVPAIGMAEHQGLTSS